MDDIECGGFIFTSNFDSGNLAHVELVLPKADLPGSRPDKHEPPDYEFNIWTRPDCMGSEFENGNRTWFYFGIRVTPKEISLRKSRPCKKGNFKYSAASTLVPISEPSALIKFNLVNMNKQAKLYAQGMAPVFRILPGQPAWERIRDRPAYMHYNGNFAISFKYRMVEDSESTTYFAFTYPYTYEELQQMLQSIDDRLGIMSPYCYRNSSKHFDQEKEIQCDIDKKKPLLVKLNNTFKSKRRSFVARKSTDSSLKSRSVIEKISLPDVCVQEVFKNCTDMDQESEHLLNKMSLEQTISHIYEANEDQKKNKNLSAGVLCKSNCSTNLKTLLPPAFSTTTIDTAENTLSSSDFPVDSSSHSSPQTNPESNAVLETVSSPQILLKQKILPNSKLNQDTISGKYRSGELSAEMAVHVARHPDDIYYCRELLIKSLQDRRVDLLTITSYRNISLDREERMEYLFPDTSVPRPHKFRNKKVIFLSARVHPGETPSSFVLNGFLHSILDRTDPVAATLRRLYVFKIIPFLNPDGVALGHYRTDSRGCNLNRVYNAPDRHLHPSVFAAKALIRYYHNDYQYSLESSSPSLTKCQSSPIEKLSISSLLQDSGVSSQHGESVPMSLFELGKLRETTNLLNTEACSPLRKLQDTLRASIDLMSRRVDVSDRSLNIPSVDEDSGIEFSKISDDVSSLLWCDVCLAGVVSGPPAGAKMLNLTTPNATSKMTTQSSNFDPSLSVTSGLSTRAGDDRTCRNCGVRQIEAPFVDSVTASSTGSSGGDCTPTVGVNPSASLPPCPTAPPRLEGAEYEQETEAPPYDAEKSGLFLYVDMHGHASKRGIFMYGNHIRGGSSAQSSVSAPHTEPNVIVHELPKVMAVNSLHFHYMACNFSERNMYVKDRRDGTSREGCGRVAVWKQTGLLRSYTLECNYNTGRMVNILPPAKHNADKHLRGGGVPPKYGPKIFEEVGRALGPSILDLTDSNPKTRLCNSDYRSMKGIRESLYKDLMLSGSAKVSRVAASGSTSGNVRARNSKTMSLHRVDKKSGKTTGRKEANARNKLASRMSAPGNTSKHGSKKLQSAASAASADVSVNPAPSKHAAALYGAFSQPSCSYEDAADGNSAASDKTPRIAKRRIGGLNKNRRSNKSGNAGLGQGKIRLKAGIKKRGGVRVLPAQRLSECSITATAASSSTSTSSSAGVRTSSPHSNNSSSDEAAAALRKMSVSSSVVSGTTLCGDRSAADMPEGGARVSKSRARLHGGIAKRTGSFGDAAGAVCLKKSKNSLRHIRENRLKQRREDLMAATTSSSATSNNGAGKPGCSAAGVKMVTSAIVRNRGSSRRCLRVSASDKRKKRKRN